MHLIKDILDFSLSSLSFSSNEEAISILGIIEIIQTAFYIMSYQHLL